LGYISHHLSLLQTVTVYICTCCFDIWSQNTLEVDKRRQSGQGKGEDVTIYLEGKMCTYSLTCIHDQVHVV